MKGGNILRSQFVTLGFYLHLKGFPQNLCGHPFILCDALCNFFPLTSGNIPDILH